jgi:hypothetical protein
MRSEYFVGKTQQVDVDGAIRSSSVTQEREKRLQAMTVRNAEEHTQK